MMFDLDMICIEYTCTPQSKGRNTKMKLELEHDSYFQRGDLLLGVRGSRFCGDIIRSQFVKEEGQE